LRRKGSPLWRNVPHPVREEEAVSPARPVSRPCSVRGHDRRGLLSASYISICAVFSGGGTALLLTPGTGVCEPVLVTDA